MMMGMMIDSDVEVIGDDVNVEVIGDDVMMMLMLM
jgi:hypothetical protein